MPTDTSYDGFNLLTMKAVAEVLHCSKAHVCHLVAGGVRGCAPLPAVHLGRRMLVRRESLLRWIQETERSTVGQSTERK
jgi:excisionase family DNA binding protein